jgi:Uma2 family endonuclease
MSLTLDPTAEAALPDRYEVVNGEVVELPPMSGFASEVANRIRDELAVHGRSSRLGRPRMDMLFRIPLPEDQSRNRNPDVAFITFDRWPEGRPLPYRGNPVDVVPDLMVEVASPTDQADDLVAKAHEYLEAGVRLVWLVYPRSRVVHAYESPTALRVFTPDMDLDGGAVLAGFQVPVAALFPPLAGPLPAEDDAA